MLIPPVRDRTPPRSVPFVPARPTPAAYLIKTPVKLGWRRRVAGQYYHRLHRTRFGNPQGYTGQNRRIRARRRMSGWPSWSAPGARPRTRYWCSPEHGLDLAPFHVQPLIRRASSTASHPHRIPSASVAARSFDSADRGWLASAPSLRLHSRGYNRRTGIPEWTRRVVHLASPRRTESGEVSGSGRAERGRDVLSRWALRNSRRRGSAARSAARHA